MTKRQGVSLTELLAQVLKMVLHGSLPTGFTHNNDLLRFSA